MGFATFYLRAKNMAPGSSPGAMLLSRTGSVMRGERMGDLVALLERLLGRGLALDGALQGKLGRLVIEILDFLVIGRIPMDEDTDADEKVIGLIDRNGAVLDAIRHRGGDGALGGAEHLDRLLGGLDGLLVEHDGGGL